MSLNPGRADLPPVDTLLETVGLSRHFGGVRAVQDVSLAVRRGEILGLIGPNGAGKTTFFNVIAGALAPTRGTIRLEGGDISRLGASARCQRGIARTFQVPKPFAHLSVRENLLVGLRHGRGRTERAREAEKTDDLIARLGLARWADLPASVLPLGARKRLEIARALATDPVILLLDEVLGGLSAGEIDEVLAVVTAMHGGGVTVVMIEHVLAGLMRVAQRVAVLHEGRLIAAGSPAEVTADPAVIDAYLGTAPLAA